MNGTDKVAEMLDRCRDGDDPAFTVVEVNGVLEVTPRLSPEAFPVRIVEDEVGLTVYYLCATRCPTPELASAAVYRIILGPLDFAGSF